MFTAGGVLSTVLQTSLLQWGSVGKMLFGLQGIFCCNTASGHWETLEARLSGGAVSRSHNTFMGGTLVLPPIPHFYKQLPQSSSSHQIPQIQTPPGVTSELPPYTSSVCGGEAVIWALSYVLSKTLLPLPESTTFPTLILFHQSCWLNVSVHLEWESLQTSQGSVAEVKVSLWLFHYNIRVLQHWIYRNLLHLRHG